MNKNVLLMNKEKELPKYFIVTINYVTGVSEELKCASWNYQPDFVEYLTTDNEFVQIIKNNILSLKYDKAYTKIIEYAVKEEREKVEKGKAKL
jgi:hypothetical protein